MGIYMQFGLFTFLKDPWHSRITQSLTWSIGIRLFSAIFGESTYVRFRLKRERFNSRRMDVCAVPALEKKWKYFVEISEIYFVGNYLKISKKFCAPACKLKKRSLKTGKILKKYRENSENLHTTFKKVSKIRLEHLYHMVQK